MENENKKTIFKKRLNPSEIRGLRDCITMYIERINEIKPSKEFAQRLLFELDQFDSSLFFTFFGLNRIFSHVEDIIKDYINDENTGKIYKDVPEKIKEDLLETKRRVEELLEKSRHAVGGHIYKDAKELFMKCVKYAECSALRELYADILSQLSGMTDWCFNAPFVLNQILGIISRALEKGSCRSYNIVARESDIEDDLDEEDEAIAED